MSFGPVVTSETLCGNTTWRDEAFRRTHSLRVGDTSVDRGSGFVIGEERTKGPLLTGGRKTCLVVKVFPPLGLTGRMCVESWL